MKCSLHETDCASRKRDSRVRPPVNAGRHARGEMNRSEEARLSQTGRGGMLDCLMKRGSWRHWVACSNA
jgi:hypothetical protein